MSIQEITQIIIDKTVSEIEKQLDLVTPTTSYKQFDQIGYDFHIWIVELSENDFII